MKLQIICFVIEIVVLLCGVTVLKIFPSSGNNNIEKLSVITEWAYKFVVNAKNVYNEMNGEEKKDNVVASLGSFAERNGIYLDKTELSALVEDAYEKMVKESQNGS